MRLSIDSTDAWLSLKRNGYNAEGKPTLVQNQMYLARHRISFGKVPVA